MTELTNIFASFSTCTHQCECKDSVYNSKSLSKLNTAKTNGLSKQK